MHDTEVLKSIANEYTKQDQVVIHIQRFHGLIIKASIAFLMQTFEEFCQ